MIVYIVFVLIILGAIVYRCVQHRDNVKKLDEYDRCLDCEDIDDSLYSIIENAYLTQNYDFVYNKRNLPLGRVNAFLNFFGKSIFTEEPYLFLCKRSSNDDEFREYGCIFGRTGVYLSKEIVPTSKSKSSTTENTGKNEVISFYGLTNIWSVGTIIIVSNVSEKGYFDKISTYNIKDAFTLQLIKKMGKAVIQNNIGFALQKGMISDEYIISPSTDQTYSFPVEFNNNVANEKFELTEDTIEDNYIESVDGYIEVSSSKYQRDIDESSKKNDKFQNRKGFGKLMNAVGVQAVTPKVNAFWGELKNHMNGSRGHGYAAEYGNNTIDRLQGRKVENLAQQLDSNGRQVKHGADRMVNDVFIQTKYYKTASETIGAAFEKKRAIYTIGEGKSERMMQIEVPKDQYQDALKLMQKRIDSNQVPNVQPGESAKDYVRKGYFTYEQSFNIAKSGTIDSLKVDIASGAVCCLQVASISAVIVFAQTVWNGATPKEAMKESLQTSLVILGKGTLIYTLTMQLSRKEIANYLAGKAYTVDGISQGFAGMANPIFTLSESMATKLRASSVASTGVGKAIGLDKVTGRQLIGTTVTVAVVFGPDVVRAMRGRISSKQLIKNSTIGAAGMIGAAIGQAAIPVPVVGAMAGGALGGIATKKIMDQFIEDDAKEMFRILKEEFIDQTMLSNLTQDEFEKVVALTISNKKTPKLLRDMFQADDSREYAKNSIMVPAIISVVAERKVITMKDYDTALLEETVEMVSA